jgi:threonine dehydratase
MAGAFAALVRKTPLVAAPGLGADVYLKLENLQRIGSFKLRGACQRIDALTDEERARGVVTASAGNHGQGVAIAASRAGVRARVIVPTTTPSIKKRAIAAYGAELIEDGDSYDAAEAAARFMAAESGAIFVSPFDDPHVIRGNGGTLGAELREQLPEVARVIAPVGGGGLIAGLADALSPSGVHVVGAQPEGNCAMFDSLAAGRALIHYSGEPTLAEGCEGAVGELTYAIAARHKITVGLCSEEGIRAAMAWAYRSHGVVCEASGAVGIAAWQEGAFADVKASPTVIVISGGNVEPDLLDEVLRGA